MFDRSRRFLALWLTVCCLSAGFVSPRAALGEADGRRANRALLIGVDEFVSKPSSYPSSTNNVFAIQEALQTSSVPFETIMIPASPVTDVKGLTELIRSTFAAADEDDASYLYISTHGEYNPASGTGAALLLSDGVTENRLSPQALQAAFDGIAGTKVLLLDACYSGAFIGKGMRTQPEDLCFVGDEFKVLTSSGAMEESWYWSAAQDGDAQEAQNQQGAFYFTQMLSQSLNPRYGSAADTNRDGSVTLKELYNTLMENHAASTPQVYPQDDDFVVFTYDLADRDTLGDDERSPIENVTFSGSTLSAEDNRLTLEFIALRPVRVAYQIVYQRDGVWRFDEAQLLYDDVERYTAYGDEEGAISAGRKVRTLTLSLQNGEESGYVLVQLVSLENGKLTVHAGRVIAIPPAQGELGLGVETPVIYTLGSARELAIYVSHLWPCQLSVTIIDQDGQTVRRLCTRQSTRPMKMVPEGSTFYWDGCGKDGQPVAAGAYRVRVTGYMGSATFTVDSDPITLTQVQP